MSDYLCMTTKGYVIEVHCLRQTVMGDIVCYSLNEEQQLAKLRTNGKGRYIDVRLHGQYYGRCYIFNSGH